MDLIKYVRAQWDRTGAVLAVVTGLACLLLGYVGASNTGLVAKQIPYFISGGLLGIFLLGVGAVLWLSADLRDEWRELRGVRTLLSEQDLRDVQSANEARQEARPFTPAREPGPRAAAQV